MHDYKQFLDQRLLVDTYSLVRRRESLNSRNFNEKCEENYFHIEDYSESLIKDYVFNYPFEKSSKQIKDNWESIYHLDVKPYIDSNKTLHKVSGHKPRQKTWLPQILTSNKNERSRSIRSLVLPEIKLKLNEKPFEPETMLQAKVQQSNENRKKSLQKQLTILNSLNLKESNSKLARNLYFHPKTLSFTPFFKSEVQKAKKIF